MVAIYPSLMALISPQLYRVNRKKLPAFPVAAHDFDRLFIIRHHRAKIAHF